MSSTQTDHAPRGEQAAAIANLVVKLTSEYTGRGPTKSRTHIEDDLVVVILRETLTKGERILVRDGREDVVRSTRFAFQQTMKDELVAGVEQILDRRVLAFMSANHMEPDVAAEIFLLESVGDNGED